MKNVLKKCSRILVAMMLAFVPILANVNDVAAEENAEITIFHTNDMHGAVEDLSYVKTLKDSTSGSILVDAGDAAQGSSLATYTQGKAIIELMNNAGYDIMTLGNHEFDYGKDAALAIANLARFPVVSANVFDDDGSLLLEGINGNNGQNYMIERNGVNIGFFGITTTETAYKTNPLKLEGITFGDEVEYSQKQVDALKAQGADIIIGILHVGIDETSDPTSYEIAQNVEGIDVIIDGHSHSVIDGTVFENTGSNSGNTVVVQTGTKLANVGEIKLEVNSNTKKLESVTTRLISSAELKANYSSDQGYVDLYTNKTAALAPILDEEVTYSTTTVFAFDTYGASGLRVSRLEESPAGDLVADAMVYEGKQMLEEFGLDYPVVALQNGGGVRANLPAGTVTVGDILDILPFGNMIAIKEITPVVLYETLEVGYAGIDVNEDGFIDVSKANGAFSQISGMQAVVDASQPSGSKVKEIYLVNEDGSTTLLDKNDSTTKIAIVSNDFEVAGGDGYTMLGDLPHIAEGGALDVVLQNYIIDHTVDGEFTYAQTFGRLVVEQIEAIQSTGYLTVTPNIELTPDTTYAVLVDGTDEVTVTTDSRGYFTLVVSNGAHTLSVEGQDYFISSYTNVNIVSFEVYEEEEIIEPITPDPEPNPDTDKGTDTDSNTGTNNKSPQTSDPTNVLPYILATSLAGGYLVFDRKRRNQQKDSI